MAFPHQPQTEQQLRKCGSILPLPFLANHLMEKFFGILNISKSSLLQKKTYNNRSTINILCCPWRRKKRSSRLHQEQYLQFSEIFALDLYLMLAYFTFKMRRQQIGMRAKKKARTEQRLKTLAKTFRVFNSRVFCD